MNKFGKFALGAAVLFGLASCATDEPAPKPGNTTSQGDVFATLTLSLPSTRSATDQTGETNSDATPEDFEIGTDAENNVQSVYVVLAAPTEEGTYTYIGSSYSESLLSTGMTGNNVTYQLAFESKTLAKNISDANKTGGDTMTVNVFAYCNPDATLQGAIKAFEDGTDTDFESFLNKTMTVEANGSGIWQDGHFLMTNAELSSRSILADYQKMVETYGNPENALHLGTVKVSRVVSRFDFKNTQFGNLEDINTYPIKIGSTGEIVAYVELTAMSLVNMAQEFYLLPRVSADGTAGTGKDWELCGGETPTNYVVSPNFGNKTGKASEADITFHYPLNSGKQTLDPAGFAYTTFTEINGKQTDNWNGNQYHVWRYCTENTIPGIANQNQGITTGVYFKGRIVAAAKAPESLDEEGVEYTMAQKVAYAMAHNKRLYFFKEDTYNTLYAGVEDLVAVAKANPNSMLYAACKKAFVDFEDEDFTPTDLTKATEGIGFYRKANGEYPLYYFYKNRHNDNGINNQRGIMEFATVRNNVYKLSVSDIHRFGHPKVDDDPDPEDPDDPDETEKVYFDVEVQVLPWVVRVNDIVFD